MTDHYLYAISNDSTHVFPENTLTAFTNLLPKSINLSDKKWGVAVVSFAVHLRLDHLWFDTSALVLERLSPQPRKLSVEGKRDHSLDDMLKSLNQLFGPLSQFDIVPQAPHRGKVVWKNTGTEDQVFRVYDDWLTRLGWVLPMEAEREQAGYFKLTLKAGQSWEGTAIGVHKARDPGLIQIDTNIIEPHPHTPGYSQVISVKALPFQEEQGIFFHHQVPRPRYFPINQTQLDSVQVRLLDKDRNPLSLLKGQPSLVEFHIKRIPRMMNPDLNLQLDSSQPGLVGGNTNQRFKIQLAKPIQVGPQARMALTQASLPNAIRNVPNKLSQVPLTVIDALGTSKIFVKAGFYPTLDALIKAINDSLQKVGLHSVLEAGRHGQRFTIRSKVNWTINVLIPSAWWGVLGASNEPNRDLEQINMMLTKRGHVYQCLADMDLFDYYPHLIIVYADVVQHSIIGDRFYPILKTLSTPPYSKDKYHQFYSEHLEYLPLSTQHISEIDIALRGSDGEPVEFDTSDHIIINVSIVDS